MNQQPSSLPARSKPEAIREMFNAIAPTYDMLNHLLSFGLDILWRKKAVTLLKEKHHKDFLDIAAGSGDLAFDVLRLHPRTLVATDFAYNMLTVLQRKIEQRNITPSPLVVSCDALHLPFKSESFDATMVAFGIRNFADRLQSLKEMHRVLRPDGISLILELTTPTVPIVKEAYSFYSKQILPMIGELISQHNSAYSYLPASISNFPPAAEFTALMKQAGFAEVTVHSLSFGVATIFVGRKTAT
ncbi:MAG: bifunctional demethylmenaquinone methyltransferase/2-methoxy-6-polyprenyl-1,4-benzoquinol methylase UbiE [Bacteroidetes bacterium]|nr:MAG: bifunctional demethylmenaquinone methyltransferase/2-methoxy-6-polyprenyl-1,4-benzoquinol methylase UbiE [Bacteroidota bacterium]